jgi:hypothetical protein
MKLLREFIDAIIAEALGNPDELQNLSHATVQDVFPQAYDAWLDITSTDVTRDRFFLWQNMLGVEPWSSLEAWFWNERSDEWQEETEAYSSTLPSDEFEDASDLIIHDGETERPTGIYTR